jgi:hypothetical protein
MLHHLSLIEDESRMIASHCSAKNSINSFIFFKHFIYVVPQMYISAFRAKWTKYCLEAKACILGISSHQPNCQAKTSIFVSALTESRDQSNDTHKNLQQSGIHTT